MSLQLFCSVLATALLTISSVQATPHFGLNARDLFVPSTTCDNFVYGQTNILIGQVCVGIQSGILTVTYPPISPYIYNETHVYVGTVPPTNRAPGSFPYSSAPGGDCTISADSTTATCSIPVLPSWRVCGQTLYLATHAAINYPNGTQGQTAWGNGICFGGTQGNCAKYWNFTEQCACKLEIDFFPITTNTTSVTTITGSSTSTFLTSTTSTYKTSSTSTYTTSTTVTYLTSTTIEYTTSGSSTSTTTSSSIFPTTISFPATYTTTTCTNPSPSVTLTTTVSTTLAATP